MKVLLIYPDTHPISIIPHGLINIEPLGLEYLAGELPDHEVVILDLKVEKHWKRVVERFGPEVVGVTGTVVHHQRMIDILTYAKRACPGVQTVVGGTHASLVPDDFLVPEVDFLIDGQDPRCFRLLVEALELRRSPEGIEGLRIRSSNSWITVPRGSPLHDLDHLPLPRRDLTSRYRSRYCHLFWRPVALMVTSVGCPQACRFCPCPVLTERRVLRRSPELVLEELAAIEEPYVYVGDDNLFFDSRHAERIADLVGQAGLKKEYYVLGRVDDIVAHPDLIRKWAEIGLRKVFLGLESPSDEEIRALNKKGSVSENNQAIEILQANGIDPLGAFIIRPEYTRADFDRVLEYMDRMNIYYFEFTILTPFPGTPFHDEVFAELLSHDTRLFDLAHSLLPTGLPAGLFYREFSRLHRRASSPLRARRIKPVVSPFRRLAYLRQASNLVQLFWSARRSYREEARLAEEENRELARVVG